MIGMFLLRQFLLRKSLIIWVQRILLGGGEDDDGNHKDYKVTFNDNNLPVRVDGLVTRRIWTVTYQ